MYVRNSVSIGTAAVSLMQLISRRSTVNNVTFISPSHGPSKDRAILHQLKKEHRNGLFMIRTWSKINSMYRQGPVCSGSSRAAVGPLAKCRLAPPPTLPWHGYSFRWTIHSNLNFVRSHSRSLIGYTQVPGSCKYTHELLVYGLPILSMPN